MRLASSVHYCIQEDFSIAIDKAVDQWTKCANQAIELKGKFIVVLSGGNSPREFYRVLTQRVSKDIWAKTYLFLVDERCVPFEHVDSNAGLIDRLIVKPLNLSSKQVHWPLIKQGESSQEIAASYEKVLKQFFGQEGIHFDLITLGIGQDGHTASLFAFDPALEEKHRWVIAVEKKDIRFSRITLALPIIQQAKNMFFLVQGSEKANVMKQFLSENKEMPAYQATLGQSSVWIFADAQAMSK